MASIVFVQPHLLFGGAERQTVIVANALVARGHECHIILHARRGGLIDDLDPMVVLHDLGLESHASIPLVALRLRRVLKDLRPSLVVVKLWSSILACSMVDRFVPKHTYNYCEDLDPRDHARFIRFGRLKQKIIGRIFRSRPIVTANTFTVASSMSEVYNLGYVPEIVPSTVDPESVKSRARDENKGLIPESSRVQVLSVGTLIPRKGLLVTLRALKTLGIPVDWHIVGEGILHSQLVGEGKQSNLRVIVHEPTPNPYGYMRSADILVHSAISEAFGIVIVEALAAGTPVISADAIGPTEIVRALGHQPHLLSLYPKGDSDALAAVLSKRIEDGLSKVDADQYIRYYTLDRAVDLWIERAERYGK